MIITNPFNELFASNALVDLVKTIFGPNLNYGEAYIAEMIWNEVSKLKWPDGTVVTCRRFEDQDMQSIVSGDLPFDSSMMNNEDIKDALPEGYTGINKDGNIEVVYFYDIGLAHAQSFKLDKSNLLHFIQMIVRHEHYHTQQFQFIIDNYGWDAMARVIEEESKAEYGQGLLEAGVEDYLLNNKEQDFTVFAKFADK